MKGTEQRGREREKSQPLQETVTYISAEDSEGPFKKGAD